MDAPPLSPAAVRLVVSCDVTRTEGVEREAAHAVRDFCATAPELAADFGALFDTLAAVLDARSTAGLALDTGRAVRLLRLASRLCAPALVGRQLSGVLADLVLAPPWELAPLAELSADEARQVDACAARLAAVGTRNACVPISRQLLPLLAALTAARPVFERGELPATLAALLATAAATAYATATLHEDLDDLAPSHDYWRACDPWLAARLREGVVRLVRGDVLRTCAAMRSQRSQRHVFAAEVAAADGGEAHLYDALEDGTVATMPPRLVIDNACVWTVPQLYCAAAPVCEGRPNRLVGGGIAALVPPSAYADAVVAEAGDRGYAAGATRCVLRLMQAMGFPVPAALP
jgi:hypothetical protein